MRAYLTCFIFSEQTLHLLRQDPRRGKEEGGNWRQRTRNPSVPVSLFIEYEIKNISCTERSEARRVATLHTDVSWVRMSETWRVACSHALSASSTSQTRPGALAHGTTASFPQENCSFPLDIHSQRFAPHSFPARLDKEIACCSKGEQEVKLFQRCASRLG